MSGRIVAILLIACAGALSAEAATPEYFPTPVGPAGPLPFSEAVRVDDMLYLSGQIGLRPGSREIVAGGIAAETRQTLENIKAILERHGSSLDRVVKCTVFMADIAEWPAMNEVYRTFFAAHLPVRSALGASGLAFGARVEIECLAVVGAPGARAASPRAADEASLRALHETILAAHRAGTVDPWMAIESADYVVANRGRLTTPTLAERRAARAAYLASTRFSVYRDRRPPIVTISDDGTRGWLLAEVEIRGLSVATGGGAGSETTIATDYAWVELYEKRDGEWRLVGNVSNQAP